MLLFIDKLGVAGFILLYGVLLLAVGVRHDPSEVLTLLLREFAIHRGVLSLLFLLRPQRRGRHQCHKYFRSTYVVIGDDEGSAAADVLIYYD